MTLKKHPRDRKPESKSLVIWAAWLVLFLVWEIRGLGRIGTLSESVWWTEFRHPVVAAGWSGLLGWLWWHITFEIPLGRTGVTVMDDLAIVAGAALVGYLLWSQTW